ncbi:hypothetical protein QWY77_14240 [Thalassotalea ponticola]|uniref:hypothetical protein n=1 Tax=Thalassotalea ponticola TaxID=1523392 RepID=UPI0025B5AFC4|nr:hypothetical protein [Thalassotalea ponticola]MDN3653896.1 hypothetical protein [Thalassotalea ponticola]
MDKQRKPLLTKHPNLSQTGNRKVVSHVQRREGDWYVNTRGAVDVPSTYKRTQPYQSLQGCRVNVNYYPPEQSIAGYTLEYMKVVRVRRS